MRIRVDLTGKKIGKLSVIKRDGRYYNCRCECGNNVMVRTSALLNGQTGCFRPGCKRGTTHGLSKKSKAYPRWQSMLARCYKPKRANYLYYGGRGIKVCSRWRKFENFLSDMGNPPNGTVLDRKDSTKGYSLRNCRWATFKTSTENRRNTIWIQGRRIDDLAKKLNMPYSRIWSRLKRGWSIEEIIKMPTRIPRGFTKNGPINPRKNAALFDLKSYPPNESRSAG